MSSPGSDRRALAAHDHHILHFALLHRQKDETKEEKILQL